VRPTAAGPSPASTGEAAPVRVRPMLTSHQIAAGKLLAETIIKAATAMINKRTRVSEDDDRWLMTKRQRDSVAAPLGRIVARRTPLPGMVDGDATDVADGVEAVMALVAYVVDQITAERPANPQYENLEQLEPADVSDFGQVGSTRSPFDPAYRTG
ncbi:hypothetical protein, partial [Streptomyces sp. NPDC056140]|uniref:hypothetical protein n=1 Tax=Streptomyces sp. NPDC056140 TaxID=3345725 RepID=UPI0035DEE748